MKPSGLCRYALSPVGVFATLFLREVTLMKRHKFVYIFRTAIVSHFLTLVHIFTTSWGFSVRVRDETLNPGTS